MNLESFLKEEGKNPIKDIYPGTQISRRHNLGLSQLPAEVDSFGLRLELSKQSRVQSLGVIR